MKKLLSTLLICAILLSTTVCFAQSSTDVTNNGTVINIDGKDISLIAYNINDNNYFKLRDIANALKGTKGHFDVKWNSEKQAVEVVSNTDYSTNEEISSKKIENITPVKSNAAIFKDGKEVLLNAYNIADNNYFKLRDLASAVNFFVGFDEANEKIYIDTNKKYEYPTANGKQIMLNTKYLSFYGMTKAEIDEKCGNTGNYLAEYGLVDYENGLMVGYNCLGTDMIPQPTDYATTLQIKLDNLFFNCPQTVTEEQINSIFGETTKSYNYMDMENLICADYCGKSLVFYPDTGLGKDTYAFLSRDSYNSATQPASIADNFSGYYETDEWVPGSYVEIANNGLSYTVNILLVRGASIENGIGTPISEKSMSVSGEEIEEEIILQWSDDYQNLSVQCADINWCYMVKSEPVQFYKK